MSGYPLPETVSLWRAQIAQDFDGTSHGLLSGDSAREPLDVMTARIRAQGLPDPAGIPWQFPDFLERRDDLQRNPALYGDKTAGSVRGFFATADQGALHGVVPLRGARQTATVAAVVQKRGRRPSR